MIHSKQLHMKLRMHGIGPGGWKCPCCAPAPKNRKPHCRAIKRGQEKAFIRKYIAEQL